MNNSAFNCLKNDTVSFFINIILFLTIILRQTLIPLHSSSDVRVMLPYRFLTIHL